MAQLFTWAAETHVGHHRDHNEDRYAVFDCPLGTAFIVCDGMGGHAAGDVAANLATQKVRELLQNATPDQPISYWLRRALFHAHHAIQNQGQLTYGAGNMGTTAVLLLLTPQGEAWWAHTGDSRLYLFRNGQLHQLTHDHSYVAFLVDSGYISPESAFGHPQSNQLLFTLGTSAPYTVVDAATYPLFLYRGDALLLCTDGVSGLIPEEEIRHILSQRKPPAERVQQLIHAALNAGGYDNATALLVEITQRTTTGVSPSPSRISLWVLPLVTALALLMGFLAGQLFPLQVQDPSPKTSSPVSTRHDSVPARQNPVPPDSQKTAPTQGEDILFTPR